MRTHTHTDISSLCQPDSRSGCKTKMLIYALVTEVYPANLWGWTSRSSDTAHVCVRMVYLYTLSVWGTVKASAGNSIMLHMAHMSGALLLCSFTPGSGWTDHISMCGSSVVHWCSICNFTSLFFWICFNSCLSLSLCCKLTTLTSFTESSHVLNKPARDDRWLLQSTNDPNVTRNFNYCLKVRFKQIFFYFDEGQVKLIIKMQSRFDEE